MIQNIKNFFSTTWWKENYGTGIIVVVYGAIVYILGAFGGALIQYMKDVSK